MRRPAPALRRRSSLAFAIGGSVLATAVHAQLGATVAVNSDLRYRGVSLSDSKPSVSLTLNYDASERWYVGGSMARTTLAFLDTYTQLTGYAGWVSPPVDGRSVEIGILATHLAGVSGYDFGEGYVGLLAERWNARLHYSPSYYGRHVETSYLDLNSHAPVGRGARLFVHVGALLPLRGGAGDARAPRFDASAGGGVVLGHWDLHIAAVTATRKGPYPAVFNGRRAALVVGASFSL